MFLVRSLALWMTVLCQLFGLLPRDGAAIGEVVGCPSLANVYFLAKLKVGCLRVCPSSLSCSIATTSSIVGMLSCLRIEECETLE